MFRRIVRWVPVLFLMFGATACDDSTSPGESAVLSVHLTDDPGAVSGVWVDVAEIYLQGGEDGRVVLLDEPTGWIKVSDLVGTTRMLASDQEVPPALYSQLRAVFVAAVLETEDGGVHVMGDPAELPEGLIQTGDLQCPSCAQSGLKVKIPNDDLDIEPGEELALVLDFDIAQSFGHKAGNSGMWVMHPTIMGILIVDVNRDGIPDEDQAGVIEGNVVLGDGVTIPACPAGTARGFEDFVPTATANTLQDDEMNPIVRTGTTDAAGAFAIDFLQTDTYTLGYQGQLDFEGASLIFAATVDPTEAVVNQDVVSGVEYTITSATCQVAGG